MSSTVLQIVNADRNFSSLVKGLKASDLEETLAGKGPFTILAPINLAFSNLPAPALDELLKPVNNGKLSDLLSCQILAEKRLYRDFTNGQKVKTINGKEMNVTVKDGEVRINGAKILAHDRQGSNGVVHSVDAVSISS
jgi:uncharacterized surface protein with fasciclin (FAS1) repeats